MEAGEAGKADAKAWVKAAHSVLSQYQAGVTTHAPDGVSEQPPPGDEVLLKVGQRTPEGAGRLARLAAIKVRGVDCCVELCACLKTWLFQDLQQSSLTKIMILGLNRDDRDAYTDSDSL